MSPQERWPRSGCVPRAARAGGDQPKAAPRGAARTPLRRGHRTARSIPSLHPERHAVLWPSCPAEIPEGVGLRVAMPTRGRGCRPSGGATPRTWFSRKTPSAKGSHVAKPASRRRTARLPALPCVPPLDAFPGRLPGSLSVPATEGMARSPFWGVGRLPILPAHASPPTQRAGPPSSSPGCSLRFLRFQEIFWPLPNTS